MKNANAQELGRLGGLARAEKLNQAQRIAIGRKGGIVRGQQMAAAKLARQKAASVMTAIVLEALDKFPPAERKRRLKAYLASGIKKENNNVD